MEKELLTTKQLAKQLKVSTDVVKNCVRRIMPDKLKNGKKTFFNEIEASNIIKDLKNNNKVMEQLTYEAGSQVGKTTTNYLEIQEAQEKSIEGVKAIKKLNIRDQYKISMEIQKNILNQLGEQNNLLLEQNNKILQLNQQLMEQNQKLENFKNETLFIANEKYKTKELRAKINKIIRQISKDRFDNNYKNTWDFFYNLYCKIHCFNGKQNLDLIQERNHLKEFYEIILNN